MNEIRLPIGSICLLKNGTKKVMVTGFCPVDNANKSIMYDYSGCMYPEGFISNKEVALFNHNQIDKIFHIGLIDEEEVYFKNKLSEMLDKIKESSQSINEQPQIIKILE